MRVADACTALVPRPMPSRAALERCRIISHRGEHDNRTVMENTLEAFRSARDAGVWGIECDIRFTRDLVPVICHDPTPERVFGPDTPVAQLDFAALRSALPQIPSLREVVQEFGGSTHLMLEIKAETWPDPPRQRDQLARELAHLEAARDYHLLALDPATFDVFDFAPKHSHLPVAELNVARMSAYALENGCAGLGGHYLLLGKRLQRRHDAAGQQLGIGFPASANALRRELNRSIQWVFSNDAVKLQGILDGYLTQR